MLWTTTKMFMNTTKRLVLIPGLESRRLEVLWMDSSLLTLGSLSIKSTAVRLAYKMLKPCMACSTELDQISFRRFHTRQSQDSLIWVDMALHLVLMVNL